MNRDTRGPTSKADQLPGIPPTITTRLTAFCLFIDRDEDATKWEEIQARAQAQGSRELRMWGGKDCRPGSNGTGREPGEYTVTLETAHLFSDQWNEADEGERRGWRLFDFYTNAHPQQGKNVRAGHLLEITEEMQHLRRTVSKCGYCGAYALTSGPVFCDACLDSEYLKESDLPLTRFRPICDTGFPHKDFPELTSEELAERLPLYRDAQVNGSTERGLRRMAEQRQRIEKDRERRHQNAEAEYHGHKWALDNVPGLDSNLIYYSHTGRFCWGWRRPLEPGEVSRLLELVSEFPYPYDIKTADGKTLSDGTPSE